MRRMTENQSNLPLPMCSIRRLQCRDNGQDGSGVSTVGVPPLAYAGLRDLAPVNHPSDISP